jgi:hypothetical protein
MSHHSCAPLKQSLPVMSSATLVSYQPHLPVLAHMINVHFCLVLLQSVPYRYYNTLSWWIICEMQWHPKPSEIVQADNHAISVYLDKINVTLCMQPCNWHLYNTRLGHILPLLVCQGVTYLFSSRVRPYKKYISICNHTYIKSFLNNHECLYRTHPSLFLKEKDAWNCLIRASWRLILGLYLQVFYAYAIAQTCTDLGRLAWSKVVFL